MDWTRFSNPLGEKIAAMNTAELDAVRYAQERATREQTPTVVYVSPGPPVKFIVRRYDDAQPRDTRMMQQFFPNPRARSRS